MENEPPEWFAKWAVGEKEFRDGTSSQLNKLLVSSGSMLEVQTKHARELKWRRMKDTLVDECEILVLGFPSNANITLEEATRRLLITMGLRDTCLYVRRARQWVSHEPSKGRAFSFPHQRDMPFVFKLGSPSVRDDIMMASSRLKDLTTERVFGFPSTNRIYLRAIWPKPIHELYSLANRVTKELKMPRPIVRQLTVFCRHAPRADLFPIYTQEDLRVLRTRSDNQDMLTGHRLPSADIATHSQSCNDQQAVQQLSLAATGLLARSHQSSHQSLNVDRTPSPLLQWPEQDQMDFQQFSTSPQQQDTTQHPIGQSTEFATLGASSQGDPRWQNQTQNRDESQNEYRNEFQRNGLQTKKP